jgi:hypothetical protein
VKKHFFSSQIINLVYRGLILHIPMVNDQRFVDSFYECMLYQSIYVTELQHVHCWALENRLPYWESVRIHVKT